MKKRICLSSFLLIFFLSACSSEAEQIETPFAIDISKYQVLAQSAEGYNSITVYQLDNSIVVNATSEAVFFDGAQFTAESENTLTAEDVTITWTTLGGGSEKTESNEKIIAEVLVKDHDTVLLDQKINFMEKAFNIIKEGLSHNMK